MTENDPQNEECYKLYLEERRELVKEASDSLKQFDRTILVYSTGAIGLSVAFLEKIAADPVRAKWVILISWLFFITTIASTTISFLTSQKALEQQVQIVWDDFYEQKRDEPAPNIYSRVTEIMNYLSGALFVTGLIFMTVFAYINIQ